MNLFARNSQAARSTAVLVFSVLAFVGASAHADTINLVTNGSFETTTASGSTEFGTRYAGQVVTGWTGTGYNFLFTSPSSVAASEYGSVSMWSDNNGFGASPDGGNFLALDGAYAQGPVSQTLNGLIVGATVTVDFYFAGAQQSGYDGATTDQLMVSLGNQTDSTQILSDTSHGFTGWNAESLTFTATSASETLSFLAKGTPAGVPPLALLDGVTATQVAPVPEPSSLLLLATGLTGLGSILRFHFTKREKDSDQE